jgi:hypothetical protein
MFASFAFAWLAAVVVAAAAARLAERLEPWLGQAVTQHLAPRFWLQMAAEGPEILSAQQTLVMAAAAELRRLVLALLEWRSRAVAARLAVRRWPRPALMACPALRLVLAAEAAAASQRRQEQRRRRILAQAVVAPVWEHHRFPALAAARVGVLTQSLIRLLRHTPIQSARQVLRARLAQAGILAVRAPLA